jgi:hypothetical protein
MPDALASGGLSGRPLQIRLPKRKFQNPNIEPPQKRARIHDV